MGMAASQARFLGLTARKSNIEYEGQQINQQRTELANQSANLYNQMLTLQVPTPPSTQDYTKVTYTFTIPGTDYSEATISQITKEPNSNPPTYTVAFSYSETDMGFPACGTSQFSTVNAYNDDTHIGNITTTKGKTYTLNYLDPTKITIQDPEHPDDPDKTIEVSQIPPEHQDAYDSLKSKGNVYWINVGTDEKPSYQYYTGTDLKNALATNGNGKTPYYYAGEITTFETETYQHCTVNRDKFNRVQSFTYNDNEYAVTTNTMTDDDAYEDAMSEYTYKSYLYEQEMNNINARTSIIQAQDKNLELRLKQLDTEHNAVQTEMESVQSVCKKNTEDTFKTFA